MRKYLAILIFCCLNMIFVVQAQDELPLLSVGKPISGELLGADATLQYRYIVEDTRLVTMQFIGETVQPAIAIAQDGASVFVDSNEAGAFFLLSEPVLSAGEYVITVTSANGAEGTVITMIQTETPIPATDLVSDVWVDGVTNAQNPIALYRFDAIPERAYLYVENLLDADGVFARLINTTTQRESATLGNDLNGGRLNIPAGNDAYQLEFVYNNSADDAAFRVCLTSVSANNCGEGDVTSDAPADMCIVMASTTAVNVRSSASAQSSIIASLQLGWSAPIRGISPDGTFYQIELSGMTGWVATSVVSANGDCDNLRVVEPPRFIPIASSTPVPPTQAPVMPTDVPPAQPTQAPTDAPSGPCLLTVNSPVYVYTVPLAQVDYLYDQVQGGELIPVGRLADNAWWKTNYMGSWISTGTFGGAVTVSGNCNLPVVTP